MKKLWNHVPTDQERCLRGFLFLGIRATLADFPKADPGDYDGRARLLHAAFMLSNLLRQMETDECRCDEFVHHFVAPEMHDELKRAGVETLQEWCAKDLRDLEAVFGACGQAVPPALHSLHRKVNAHSFALPMRSMASRLPACEHPKREPADAPTCELEPA